MADDEKPFVPVTRDDVSDLAGLPRRVEQLAEDVRTGFDMLGQRILPRFDRIDVMLDDLALRVAGNERDHLALVAAVDRDRIATDKRLSALEAAQLPQPRIRAKRPPVKKRR